MYESQQQVSSKVVVHYARSTPTFWGSHYVLCLHGSMGTYQSTFGRIMKEFDTSNFTFVAWNAPDRPNGFIQVPWPRKEQNGVDENKLTNGAIFDEVDRTRSWTDSIEQNADHAGTLMQNLFYTPFSILAHEDGAVTALHLAAKHPSYVQSLVLWQPLPKITQKHLQELNALKYMSDKHTARNFFDANDREKFLTRLWEDRKQLVSDCRPQISPQTLSEVQSSVLILQSRDDMYSQLDQSRYIQQYVPNVRCGFSVLYISRSEINRIETCDNAGMHMHETRFDWFKRNVEQFLNDNKD